MLKGLIIGILILLLVFVILIFLDTVYHQPISASAPVKVELSSTPVIFTSNRDGNSEIYITDESGSDQYRLTNNSPEDILPALSPDKDSFVYCSAEDGIYILYSCALWEVECSAVTKISKEPVSLTYSPDGQRLLSVQAESGELSLWMISLSDSASELVDMDATFGSWSQDGKIILYEKDIKENKQVWMRSINSQGALDQPYLVVDSAAAPLPDSSKLYYIDLSGALPSLARSTFRGEEKEVLVDLPDVSADLTLELKETDYPSRILLLASGRDLSAYALSLIEKKITPLGISKNNPEYIADDVIVFEKEDSQGKSQIWIENKDGERQLTSQGENWL